jgi:hypothetical protein
MDQVTRKCYEQAKEARKQHESEISEAYLYTFPNRDIWRNMEGQTDRTKLFDATATDSVQNLVSTILTLLIPQNQQWAYIDVRDDRKQKVAYDIKKILDQANKTVFKTLRDSNFYTAAAEALTDSVIAGTGAMALYNREGGGIDFAAIPTNQLYFLTEYNDKIETVFREHKVSVQYAFEKYGAFDSQIEKQATESPHSKIDLIECVMRKTNQPLMYKVFAGKKMVEVQCDEVPVSPFVVFRFGKTLGETWGESPVRQALPHIRTVNEIASLILTHNSFAGLGAWMVSSDTTVNYSNMKIRPGEVITVDQPLQPIPNAGNFQMSQINLEDQRGNIRRQLFNDAMQPLSAGPSYMTAAEVQYRQAEFFRRIGPYGLRLEQEFLRPLIRALVIKLIKQGTVPEFVVDNSTFEFVVNSTVKKGIAMQELQKDMQILGVLAQLGPEAMVNVDLNKMARKLLRDGDMTPEVVRTEEEVVKILEQQKQQMQLNEITEQVNEAINQSPNAQQIPTAPTPPTQ